MEVIFCELPKMNIPLRKGHHDIMLGQCFIDHVTQVTGDNRPGYFRLELDPNIQTEEQCVATKILKLHLGPRIFFNQPVLIRNFEEQIGYLSC